jgi:hypothetical protein
MKKFIIFLCAPLLCFIFVRPIGAVYIFDQGFESLQSPPKEPQGISELSSLDRAKSKLSEGETSKDKQLGEGTLSQEAKRGYYRADASLGGSGVSDARDMQPINASKGSAYFGDGTVGDTINRQTTPVSPTVGDSINKQPNFPVKVARPKPEIITVTPEQEKKIEDTGVVPPE